MNNRNLNNLFIFAAGAISGSLVTWSLTKRYYKRIADEEIESVKETFSSHYDHDPADDVQIEECTADDIEVITGTSIPKKPDLMEYAAIIKDQGYVNYSNTTDSTDPKNNTTKEEPNMAKPYVINPVDFGEDYEVVSLNYYANGVLTDDQDEPIENVDDIVGTDFMNHFGEYEEDSVFVRNDERKTDYEILRDNRKYAGVDGED